MNTLLLWIFCPLMAYAQTYHIAQEEISTMSFASANSGVCLWKLNQIPKNPALLARQSGMAFNILSRNYFFTPGILNVSVAYSNVLNQNSGYAIVLGTSGSKDYYQYALRAGYGRSLGRKTMVGASMHFTTNQTSEHHGSVDANFSLGICSQLLQTLMIGCFFQNPGQFFQPKGHSVPVLIKTGFNYRIHENLEVMTELHQPYQEPSAIAFGLLYSPVVNLQLAIGIKTVGPRLSLGFKYSISDSWNWSSGFEHQPSLGISLCSEFEYRVNKR